LDAIGAVYTGDTLGARGAIDTGGSLDEAAVDPAIGVLVPDPQVASGFHYPGVTRVAGWGEVAHGVDCAVDRDAGAGRSLGARGASGTNIPLTSGRAIDDLE